MSFCLYLHYTSKIQPLLPFLPDLKIDFHTNTTYTGFVQSVHIPFVHTRVYVQWLNYYVTVAPDIELFRQRSFIGLTVQAEFQKRRFAFVHVPRFQGAFSANGVRVRKNHVGRRFFWY